ncbi:protein translocase subunit secF [Desulfacinum hydrothermale DSM 13146]|uniref:Protein-export membrane protein SecF n=1 Tax=Desulfacinum hydrothermale DSM 13146 TaxID=1121390 RepID=A0A1W1X946_9BACT|nr:protein translocase subunit SecF [Desulfacinum hydrothermale]SMC20436.1 protein translocase subunit secF [Desulfacinum hydrothermale DSM 13146]
MELIKPDINVNFVGMRFKAITLSVVVILLGLAALVWRGGLNLGVDFAGGTLVQVKFQETTTPEQIRGALKDLGIGRSAIQQVGAREDNEFLVRADVKSAETKSVGEAIQEHLDKVFGPGKSTIRRAEMVGPKVGKDLRQKALLAIYYSLLFIALYISGRFELKWGTSGIMAGGLLAGVYVLRLLGMPPTYLIIGALLLTVVLCWVLRLPYALAAVLALIHDVLITLGAFAITNKEFSLTVVAALLTIVGYSLNDTTIVFDRIRENLRSSKREDFKVLVNRSINQTMSRTILTSGTTLAVVLSLFVLGGTVIHDFAFALLIGVVVGTYSSIFIASPLLILYQDWAPGGQARRSRTAARA